VAQRVELRRLDGLIVAMTGPGEKPFLRYEIVQPIGVLRILSTYVPPELRGRGLAETLVREAISLAREKGLKIEPVCSYAVRFFIRYKSEREALVDWLRDKTDEELEAYYRYALSLEKSNRA